MAQTPNPDPESRISPTPFDNGWSALLNPGAATAFFHDHAPPLDATVSGFSVTLAWWCAELSRLIYRQEADEIGAAAMGPTRDELLAAVGLRESVLIRGPLGADVAIVTPPDAPRFAVLVFRGSHDIRDWLSNSTAIGVPWRAGGVVHKGFADVLTGVWPRIEAELRQVGAPTTLYTGHSLGGALATLAASLGSPRALYTLGSPRVGDAAFAASVAHVPHYRIVNNRDIVTTLPPPVGPPGYRHHGTLMHVTRDSRILVEANEDVIAAARDVNDSMWPTSARQWAQIFDLQPARFLADHAPVNYVAHLARNLAAR